MAVLEPDPSPLAVLGPERWAAFLEVDPWQRAEIEAGLEEAEAGDFTGAHEVATVFSPQGYRA